MKYLKMLLCVAFAIVACGRSSYSGSSVPSESDASAVLMHAMPKKLPDGGTWKLLRFKKVDGRSGEMQGFKVYELEFEAEIEYPDGMYLECKGGDAFRRANKLHTFYDPSTKSNRFCAGLEILEKGARKIIKNKFVFEKTEKGWRGPDGNVY